MKKIYAIFLAFGLLLTSRAEACMDIAPTKNVIEQATTVFSGVVESVTPRAKESEYDERPETLHIRLSKTIKGAPDPLTHIKTTSCNVPHWLPGGHVLVIVWPGDAYFVIQDQPLKQ